MKTRFAVLRLIKEKWELQGVAPADNEDEAIRIIQRYTMHKVGVGQWMAKKYKVTKK